MAFSNTNEIQTEIQKDIASEMNEVQVNNAKIQTDMKVISNMFVLKSNNVIDFDTYPNELLKYKIQYDIIIQQYDDLIDNVSELVDTQQPYTAEITKSLQLISDIQVIRNTLNSYVKSKNEIVVEVVEVDVIVITPELPQVIESRPEVEEPTIVVTNIEYVPLTISQETDDAVELKSRDRFLRIRNR